MGRERAARRSRWAGRLDLATPSWTPRVPNILIGTTGVFAQGSVRFVYSIIVAATMSAAVLGELNTLVSLAMLATMLWPTAAGYATTKYVALARGAGDAEGATAVAALLMRRVLVSSVCLALAVGAVAVTLLDASWGQALQSAGLVIAYSVYTYARGVVYGVQQIPRATAWDVVSAAIALVGLVLVTALGERSILLLPLTAGYLCYSALNWPKARPGVLSHARRQEIDRFVAFGVVGVLASAGLPQVAMVVAKVTTGAAHAGQLAAALSLATPSAMLASAITLVMSPALAKMVGRGDVDLARHHTDRATRALVALMIGLFGALILMSNTLVTLFFPGNYDEAADLLPVLLVAVLVTTVAVAATTYLLVAHLHGQRLLAIVNVGGFALGIATMSALLAVRDDTTSVAWGYLAGSSVVGIVPMIVVWRHGRHRWGATAIRAGSGAVLILAGRLAETRASGSVVPGILATGIFAACWVPIAWRDLRHAIPELTGRAGISAIPQPGLAEPSTEGPRT